MGCLFFQQNLRTLQLDRHGSAFHLPLHYPNYYHQMHAPLTPHVPIPSSNLTPQSSTAPQPKISFDPYGPYPAESVNEPLEHLRYLAERYKTSSGLIEPLNLSIKASKQGTRSNPASSFSPPSSSKNPKFLNKPSPLYSPHCPQVVRSERCEVQDGETGSSVTTHSYPANAQEVYVVDDNSMTASSSPTYEPAVTLKTDKGTPTTSQKPSSPQMDLTPQAKEKREGSPEITGLSLSQTLPGLPRENERGEMEIEVPLSVFHKWLKLCRSSATMQEHRQPPTHPTQDHSGQRNCLEPDVLPTNLSFHMNPQHRHSVGEDLRLRQRNLPSPVPAIETTSNHHNMSQNPYTCYKPLSSKGTLQNVASQNDYLYDQQDIRRSCSTKQPNGWDAYDHETPSQAKTDSNQVTVQPNFEPYNSNNEDTVQRGVQKSETAPSAVFMLNSSSTSLLHLTTEEVLKLKKIISSSLWRSVEITALTLHRHHVQAVSHRFALSCILMTSCFVHKYSF